MFPEPIEQIRHVEPVQSARGGVITRVTMRLSDGHTVSFYEAAIGGRVTPCDSRADAFAIIRNGS